jgi:hypothetical protein
MRNYFQCRGYLARICFPDENQIVGAGKTAPAVAWPPPGVKKPVHSRHARLNIFCCNSIGIDLSWQPVALSQ